MPSLRNHAAENILTDLADDENGSFDRVHDREALEYLENRREGDALVQDILALVDQLSSAVANYEQAQHDEGRSGPDERDANEMHEELDEVREEARELLKEYFQKDLSTLPTVCIEHTGGNCTAFKVSWGKRHLLITAHTDPTVPDAEANAVGVGLFNNYTDGLIGDALVVGDES